MNAKDKKKAIEILAAEYPDAKPALKFGSPYQLLVAVVLSAQCTDERVNKVTAVLFKEHGTPETMAALSQEELEKYIYSCGFYHNKAAHILSATHDILTRFGGEVPATPEELQALAGRGQKDGERGVFGGVRRKCDRCGYARFSRFKPFGAGNRENAGAGGKGLQRSIDENLWSKAHHYLIWHGRKVCHSQKPDCGHCALNEICDYAKKH